MSEGKKVFKKKITVGGRKLFLADFGEGRLISIAEDGNFEFDFAFAQEKGNGFAEARKNWNNSTEWEFAQKAREIIPYVEDLLNTLEEMVRRVPGMVPGTMTEEEM